MKAMLRGAKRKRLSRAGFLAIALLLACLPLVALKVESFEYSAISVVAAGITLFWFAILVGRLDNVA